MLKESDEINEERREEKKNPEKSNQINLMAKALIADIDKTKHIIAHELAISGHILLVFNPKLNNSSIGMVDPNQYDVIFKNQQEEVFQKSDDGTLLHARIINRNILDK